MHIYVKIIYIRDLFFTLAVFQEEEITEDLLQFFYGNSL
jgi:hypothetical protein